MGQYFYSWISGLGDTYSTPQSPDGHQEDTVVEIIYAASDVRLTILSLIFSHKLHGQSDLKITFEKITDNGLQQFKASCYNYYC